MTAIRFIAGCMLFLVVDLAQAQDVPRYRVDPAWPKPLPNNWIIGQVSGMAVDREGRIWVLHRPRTVTADEAWAAQKPPRAECCIPAPSVLVFDVDGNLLKSWGGPRHVPEWPVSEHGIFVDRQGNVWLAGSGDGDTVLKFTNDGNLLLLQIGLRTSAQQVQNNQDAAPGRTAGMEVDDSAREVYLADGYLNRRVVVYDSETGEFKRGWGAYGIALSEIDNDPPPPYDPSAAPLKQFRNPVHCARLSADGLLYVCDRSSNRIQVFTRQGKFVRELFVARETLERGAAGTVNFSTDPQQKYLLVGDIMNNVVWILNRSDGAVAGRFGGHGRGAGQFHWLHVIAMDARGNLYTGEVDTGRRIQKFVLVK